MDCSGLTAPILAMRAMGFSAEQVFSSEVVEYKRDFVRLNAPGAALCEDMSRRDHGSMPACERLRFPVQALALVSQQDKLFWGPGAKVFFETAKTTQAGLPPAVVFENAQGIKEVLPRIHRALKKLGGM